MHAHLEYGLILDVVQRRVDLPLQLVQADDVPGHLVPEADDRRNASGLFTVATLGGLLAVGRDVQHPRVPDDAVHGKLRTGETDGLERPEGRVDRGNIYAVQVVLDDLGKEET